MLQLFVIQCCEDLKISDLKEVIDVEKLIQYVLFLFHTC